MFGFFLTVVARALFTMRRSEIEAAAAIPMADERPAAETTPKETTAQEMTHE